MEAACAVPLAAPAAGSPSRPRCLRTGCLPLISLRRRNSITENVEVASGSRRRPVSELSFLKPRGEGAAVG